MKETSSSAGEKRKDIRQRVGYALHDLIQAVEAARDRAAKRHNLHPTDFACIGYLYRASGPISPKQIIAQAGLSSGSGTALLDRLEAAGYTRRIPNPGDRRSVLIELDLVAAAEPVRLFLEIEDGYRTLTEKVPSKDLEMIATFLEGVTALSSKMGYV
jgi:DNA-binding MarR family transcriptional regulator